MSEDNKIYTIKNKVVLVTGASRGIGKAICLKLADHKVRLSIVARNKKELFQLKQELEEKSIQVKVICQDLLQEHAPEKIIKTTVDYFGQLDVLINNAGIALNKSFIKTTAGDWDRILIVNSKAPFFLCQYALPYLKKSESRCIINISSVVGRKGYVNQAAYTASKHAMMGFSKVLAREVQHDDIRVHVIAPGGVDTDLVEKIRPDIKKSNLIKPEEIAQIVIFLLTQRGNFVIDEINVRRVKSLPWQ